MHRVYVPTAAPPAVVVTGDEAHHLTRVCRLRAADDVVVFDGAGHEWHGRISSVNRAGVAIDLVASRTPVPEPAVFVALGIAVLKGDQMDTVIRDATALGVSAIVSFVSSHVTVPEQAWRRVSIERWRRVAVAAAKQSGRAVVPALTGVQPFATVATDPEFDARIMCVEPRTGQARPSVSLPRPRRALLLVGPEGGWTSEEIALVSASGGQTLGLGPRTLRAETAPVVALTALWSAWGWV